MAENDLGISVGEQIKSEGKFGVFDKQMKGSCGTLHVTKEEDIPAVMKSAWDLSKATKLPAVVVVRAS